VSRFFLAPIAGMGGEGVIERLAVDVLCGGRWRATEGGKSSLVL
jgi:hypothetical protein